MLRRRNTDAGFTMVELIITIGILAVLAGVTMATVTGAMKTTTVNTCKSDWAAVNNATNSYLTYNATLPLSTTSTLAQDTDVLTKTGLLAANGFISPLSSSSKYKIVVTWVNAGTAVTEVSSTATTAVTAANVGVYDSTGVNQYPASGATNTAADCSSIP